MKNQLIEQLKKNPRVWAKVEKYGIQNAWKYITIDCLNNGGYDYKLELPYFISILRSDNLESARKKISMIEYNFSFIVRIGADYNLLVKFFDDAIAEPYIEKIQSAINRFQKYLSDEFKNFPEVFKDGFFQDNYALEAWREQHQSDYNTFKDILKNSSKEEKVRSTLIKVD